MAILWKKCGTIAEPIRMSGEKVRRQRKKKARKKDLGFFLSETTFSYELLANMTVEELQDEICAIDAIFPGVTTKLAPQIYEFKVPEHEELLIQMSFVEVYPDAAPDILQVRTTNPNKYTDLNYLENSFNSTLSSIFNVGEVCLFEFFSELEQSLVVYDVRDVEEQARVLAEEQKVKKEDRDINPSRYMNKSASEATPEPEIDPLEGFTQSEVIEDRGSKFIAYAREVHSVAEAQQFLSQLLQDRRIQRAAHNMTAWRIKGENGVQFQDCDDDGETAAGSRMLHLLTMINVWNVMVVVSRWFGGIHIGPDRFKHINSSARNAVLKVTTSADAENSKKKKK